MSWAESLSTYVWFFAVGRGNSAFLRSPLNQGFILDMAGGEFVDSAKILRTQFVGKLDEYKERKIAQVVLSHPHTDHIAQCAELASSDLYPALLTCPHDREEAGLLEAVDWKRIKNPEGKEEIVASYRRLYEKRTLPLQTIEFDSRRTVPNLEYGIYYLRPPVCSVLHESDDNKYANAMSIVYYYRHGSHTILFPGDATPEALEVILRDGEGVEKRYTEFRSDSRGRHAEWHRKTSDQPSLGSLLRERGLSILVAPHHGLESGYSEALYKCIRGQAPSLVVLSERRHSNSNDGKTDARYYGEQGARGLEVSIDGGGSEFRRTVSTKDGDHILIILSGTGLPRVSLRKDIGDLLAVANR